MSVDEDIGLPGGSDDERELLLSWLGYLRGAVLRKLAYEQRGAATDAVIRSAASLSTPCSMRLGTDLRWVVLHLINETARHAGHADAVRELLDGSIGE